MKKSTKKVDVPLFLFTLHRNDNAHRQKSKPRAKKLINKSIRLHCLSQWWNQNYSHQKRLEPLIEHPLSHLVITVLVIGECAAVITEILLYNVQQQSQCNFSSNSSDLHSERNLERAIQTSHYVSLCILTLFIFEILLKIYALGYHYWNCKENHRLDYFDACLVVFSLTIEIYFLTVNEAPIIARSAILIVILRLWHLLRIANAVIRCFHNVEDYKVIRHRSHKTKPSKVLLVPSSIQTILDLMQEKTAYLRYDITIEQSLVARFEEIDEKCQGAFDDYYGDETKLLEEIQKLQLITRRIPEDSDYLATV